MLFRSSDVYKRQVVNEEFATTYWPKQDPIGKRFRLNDNKGPWLSLIHI